MRCKVCNRPINPGAGDLPPLWSADSIMNSTCFIPECDRSVMARRLCNRHYWQWRSGVLRVDAPRLVPVGSHFKQFVRKVAFSPGSCWEWQGALSGGYGTCTWEGKTHYAHRIAYELWAGPILAGLQLDHLCRNRRCVNPSHLEPVTQRENMLRGTGPSAICAASTECIHGHPFDDVNTYIRPDKGTRMCRTCTRRRNAESRLRRREVTPSGAIT